MRILSRLLIPTDALVRVKKLEVISPVLAKLTKEYNKGLLSGTLVGFLLGIVTTLIVILG